MTYKYCINTTNSAVGCTETAFTGVTTWTFTGQASPQTYYYFIKAKDGLNNSGAWSSSVTTTFDNEAPVSGSFTINNNATGTTTTAVTLNLTCGSDA